MYEKTNSEANNFSKPDDFFSENQSFSLLIQKKAVSLQPKTNDNSN